jgi:hypothetical protein
MVAFCGREKVRMFRAPATSEKKSEGDKKSEEKSFEERKRERGGGKPVAGGMGITAQQAGSERSLSFFRSRRRCICRLEVALSSPSASCSLKTLAL